MADEKTEVQMELSEDGRLLEIVGGINDQGDQSEVVLHNEEQKEIIAVLQQLVSDTNEALSKATIDRFENESIHDACVNWADLSCVGARRWIDETGELGWQVDVSEANPDGNSRFKAYVANFLSNRGWENVIVMLEW